MCKIQVMAIHKIKKIYFQEDVFFINPQYGKLVSVQRLKKDIINNLKETIA